MLLLRRITAIALLASFAGSLPASSACAMTSAVESSKAAVAEPVSAHVHHEADSPVSFEAGPVRGQSHSGPASSCGPVMACAAAALAGSTSTVPTSRLTVEAPVAAPAAAHATPSLAFEPPPPRRHLI
jgi:hypothetical protein